MSGFNSSNGIDLVFSLPVLIFFNTLCPIIIDQVIKIYIPKVSLPIFHFIR